jgi:hypothetical protein
VNRIRSIVIHAPVRLGRPFSHVRTNRRGEALVVEVVSGEAGRGAVEAEGLRFKDTLSGDPSGWVNAHSPSRSQPWRLWYRIENAPQE